MFFTFLMRGLLPHAVLAAVIALGFAVYPHGEDFLTLAVWLGPWIAFVWSMLLMGGPDGTREILRALGRKAPSWQGGTVIAAAFAIIWIVATANAVERPRLGKTGGFWFVAVPHTFFVVLLLTCADCYGAFCRHVESILRQRREEARMRRERERAEAEVRRQRLAARQAVWQVYQPNEPYLQARLPACILEGQLNAQTADHVAVADAWAAAQNLIGQLRQLIVEEKAKHDERARALAEQERAQQQRTQRQRERRGQLERQIDDCQREMDRLRQAPVSPGIVEEEMLRLQRIIGDCRQQIELLDAAERN